MEEHSSIKGSGRTLQLKTKPLYNFVCESVHTCLSMWSTEVNRVSSLLLNYLGKRALKAPGACCFD